MSRLKHLTKTELDEFLHIENTKGYHYNSTFLCQCEKCIRIRELYLTNTTRARMNAYATRKSASLGLE